MDESLSRSVGSGRRLTRTVIVVATLLVPLGVIAFAVRSDDDPNTSETGTASTTAVESTISTTAPPATDPPSTDSPLGETTTTAVTTTSSTTTSTTTTTTTEAIPEAVGVGSVVARQPTLFATQAGVASGTQIAEGDVLTMTGDLRVVAGATWFEAISANESGWVSASNVALSTTGFDQRQCAELPSGTTATPLAYRPGTADGLADGVVAIETHMSDECTRTVLLLGLDGGETLAQAFPDDLAIVDFGGHLRIDLDDAVHAPEIAFRGLVSNGVMATVETSDGTRLIIDRGPSAVSVSFLARPARVVIDSRTVSDVRPGIGGGIILSSQSITDATTSGDGRVTVMSGWARPINGLGEVAFRHAPDDDQEPGGGLAAPVVFSGTSSVGTVERSWYFYRTEVPAAWSPFAFQISSLSAGEYEVFLGVGVDANVPADIDSPGLFQILTVE